MEIILLTLMAILALVVIEFQKNSMSHMMRVRTQQSPNRAPLRRRYGVDIVSIESGRERPTRS